MSGNNLEPVDVSTGNDAPSPEQALEDTEARQIDRPQLLTRKEKLAVIKKWEDSYYVTYDNNPPVNELSITNKDFINILETMKTNPNDSWFIEDQLQAALILLIQNVDNENFMVVPPTQGQKLCFLGQGRLENKEEWMGELKTFIERLGDKGTRWLVVPCNDGMMSVEERETHTGSHWGLLVVDKQTNQASYIDGSLDVRKDQDGQDVIHSSLKVGRAAGNILHGIELVTAAEKKGYNAKTLMYVPKQSKHNKFRDDEGAACGPYVYAILEFTCAESKDDSFSDLFSTFSKDKVDENAYKMDFNSWEARKQVQRLIREKWQENRGLIDDSFMGLTGEIASILELWSPEYVLLKLKDFRAEATNPPSDKYRPPRKNGNDDDGDDEDHDDGGDGGRVGGFRLEEIEEYQKALESGQVEPNEQMDEIIAHNQSLLTMAKTTTKGSGKDNQSTDANQSQAADVSQEKTADAPQEEVIVIPEDDTDNSRRRKKDNIWDLAGQEYPKWNEVKGNKSGVYGIHELQRNFLRMRRKELDIWLWKNGPICKNHKPGQNIWADRFYLQSCMGGGWAPSIVPSIDLSNTLRDSTWLRDLCGISPDDDYARQTLSGAREREVRKVLGDAVRKENVVDRRRQLKFYPEKLLEAANIPPYLLQPIIIEKKRATDRTSRAELEIFDWEKETILAKALMHARAYLFYKEGGDFRNPEMLSNEQIVDWAVRFRNFGHPFRTQIHDTEAEVEQLRRELDTIATRTLNHEEREIYEQAQQPKSQGKKRKASEIVENATKKQKGVGDSLTSEPKPPRSSPIITRNKEKVRLRKNRENPPREHSPIPGWMDRHGKSDGGVSHNIDETVYPSSPGVIPFLPPDPDEFIKKPRPPPKPKSIAKKAPKGNQKGSKTGGSSVSKPQTKPRAQSQPPKLGPDAPEAASNTDAGNEGGSRRSKRTLERKDYRGM